MTNNRIGLQLKTLNINQTKEIFFFKIILKVSNFYLLFDF